MNCHSRGQVGIQKKWQLPAGESSQYLIQLLGARISSPFLAPSVPKGLSSHPVRCPLGFSSPSAFLPLFTGSPRPLALRGNIRRSPAKLLYTISSARAPARLTGIQNSSNAFAHRRSDKSFVNIRSSSSEFLADDSPEWKKSCRSH